MKESPAASPISPAHLADPPARVRWRTLARFLLLGAFCWYGMMWVHESGHVLACVAAGGRIERVVLIPWGFSRTDPARDPHPLWTVWGGPLIGTLLPLAATLGWRRPRSLRLFAAYCAFANGAYIFFGSFQRIADPSVMLKLGSPSCLLWSFGIGAMSLGLCLVRTLGRWAGLATEPTPYRRWELAAAGVLVFAMIVAGALWFPDSP